MFVTLIFCILSLLLCDVVLSILTYPFILTTTQELLDSLRDANADNVDRIARLEALVREKDDKLHERTVRMERLERRLEERDDQLRDLNAVEAEVCVCGFCGSACLLSVC